MKQKTKKAASKRFQVSTNGIIHRRRTHQAHFNSRDTGQQGRVKRPNIPTHHSDQGRILELLPYSKQ